MKTDLRNLLVVYYFAVNNSIANKDSNKFHKKL